MELISPEGLRQDGRRALELRQLCCSFGVIDKADGSAQHEMGNTKVLELLSFELAVPAFWHPLDTKFIAGGGRRIRPAL